MWKNKTHKKEDWKEIVQHLFSILNIPTETIFIIFYILILLSLGDSSFTSAALQFS